MVETVVVTVDNHESSTPNNSDRPPCCLVVCFAFTWVAFMTLVSRAFYFVGLALWREMTNTKFDPNYADFTLVNQIIGFGVFILCSIVILTVGVVCKAFIESMNKYFNCYTVRK